MGRQGHLQRCLRQCRRQPLALAALRDAATLYKVDVDAIGLKVRQEFAVKQKAQTAKKGIAKVQPKPAKKAKAA